MIIVACVDSSGGLLFNRRRQSQDRLLRQNLLEEAAGRVLWMNEYSRKQFEPAPENLRVSEDFPSRAGPGELCFFEDVDPTPWLADAEKLLLYRWNRTYPADRRLPSLPGWTLSCREDFPGFSHERITKEVFLRSKN